MCAMPMSRHFYIAVTPSGTNLCFYGRTGDNMGLSFYADGRLTVARFNLDWPTDVKDEVK
ncbi:hypothetical protein [Planctomicrobium piriforme]|uniref:Uncharacterized protein n=1 Tax=Planctomicrobium piriforme TaxID=1576369 RepID=A0A1I3D773_9PLAN|nr:hypothetical protein [Planctomicrobium piriforme]SFH82610.1 hypothetical protein SAMN05421753_103121 [Planctomicrobium piriforme]